MTRTGFLIVDKPAGITSHDVVATIRAVTGIRKVGHTGTLDPFATGVLPVAVGRSTRLIQFLDESCKVYEAIVSLGRSTDTADPTGEVKAEAAVPALDEADVRRVLESFVGDRMQRPPAYSAVKVKGKRLHQYAREGTPVQAKARPVRIDSMEMTSLTDTEIGVRITCSRGTYVRVIAEEIADALGTVGHLGRLQRSRSGPFAIDKALCFPRLSELVADREDWSAVLRPRKDEERVPWAPREAVWDRLQPWLCSPASVLGHLPAVALSPAQRDLLCQRGAAPSPPAEVEVGGHFVALFEAGLVAVCRREEGGPKLARMFASA